MAVDVGRRGSTSILRECRRRHLDCRDRWTRVQNNSAASSGGFTAWIQRRTSYGEVLPPSKRPAERNVSFERRPREAQRCEPSELSRFADVRERLSRLCLALCHASAVLPGSFSASVQWETSYGEVLPPSKRPVKRNAGRDERA